MQKMARDAMENLVFGGVAVGTGFGIEMISATVNQEQNETLPMIVGLGIGALGIGITMFSRDRMIEAVGDGMAGAGLGWTGAQVQGMMAGSHQRIAPRPRIVQQRTQPSRPVAVLPSRGTVQAIPSSGSRMGVQRGTNSGSSRTKASSNTRSASNGAVASF
jgi:hypothetical protein